MKRILLGLGAIFVLTSTATAEVKRTDRIPKFYGIDLDTIGTAKQVRVGIQNSGGDSLLIHFLDSVDCGYIVYSRATERLYLKRCDGGALIALDSLGGAGAGTIDSVYVVYAADVASVTSGWLFTGDTLYVDTADATGGGGGTSDSIGVDTSSSGGADAYVYPAVIRGSPNTKLVVAGDTLTVSGRVLEMATSGKPYDSLKDALNAAVAGDLILVHPGTYNDSVKTQLKDHVDIFLSQGARIVNNRKAVSGDGGTVFLDTLGVTARIFGQGVIRYDTSDNTDESFIVSVTSDSSDVYVEADTLYGWNMGFQADRGRLTVRGKSMIACGEHGVRLRSGGFFEMFGDFMVMDSANNGGGQGVYYNTGDDDTAIIHGNLIFEGGFGAVFDENAARRPVFKIYGNITATVDGPAISLDSGTAYIYDGIVRSKGTIKCENLYAYNTYFDQAATGSTFLGNGAGDTLHLWNCAGDSGITAGTVVYGDYRRESTGLTMYPNGQYDLLGFERVEAETSLTSLAKMDDFELNVAGTNALYDSTDVATNGQQLTWVTGNIVRWEDAAAAGGDTTAKVLYDPGTVSDSLKWGVDGTSADTLTADGAGTITVILRSPDTLQVEADVIGKPAGTGATVMAQDTTRNDAGTAHLGTDAFPWKFMWMRDWEWDAGTEEAQYDTTDTPTNGQQLTWSTGGVVGWSAAGSGGTSFADTAGFLTTSSGSGEWATLSASNNALLPSVTATYDIGIGAATWRDGNFSRKVVVPYLDAESLFTGNEVTLPLVIGADTTRPDDNSVNLLGTPAFSWSAIYGDSVESATGFYAERAWFGTSTNDWRMPRTAGTDNQVLTLDTDPSPDTAMWATPTGGSGDDTGAYVDADGGSTLERPYLDIFNAGALADTFALLTDSTQALLWTDSTLAVRGKQGTVAGDTTGDNKFRVVVNNVEMLDIDDDSIDVNNKDVLNVDSIDATNYTDQRVDPHDLDSTGTFVFGRAFRTTSAGGAVADSEYATRRQVRSIIGDSTDPYLNIQGARPLLHWDFSTTTTDSDPGSGIMRFNNATISSATAAYVDDNVSTNSMAIVDSSVSKIGVSDILLFMSPGTAGKRYVFRVGAVTTDGTGYWKITSMTHIANGGTAFGNGDSVWLYVFTHSPTGSNGLLNRLTDETGSGTGTPLVVFNQNPTIAGLTGSGSFDLSSVTVDGTGAGDFTFDPNEVVDTDIDWPGHWRMPDRWATRANQTADSLILMRTLYAMSGDSGTTEIWDVADSSYDASGTQLADTLWGFWLTGPDEERIDSIMLMLDNEPTANDSSCVKKIQLFPFAGHAMDVSTADLEITTGWVNSSSNQSFVIDNTDVTTPDPGEFYAVRIILGVTSGATKGRISFNLMAYFDD